MKTFLQNLLYIKFYNEQKYSNRLLVVGILRGLFGFKMFKYISLGLLLLVTLAAQY